MKLTTLLLAVLLSLFDLSLAQKPPKLQIFVESLCTDTAKWVTFQLKSLIDNEHYHQLVGSIEIIPYGKVVISTADGVHSYKCQHGDNECYGNKIQNCGISILNKNSFFDLMFCHYEIIYREGRFNQDFEKILSNCIDNQNQVNDILDCANSDMGLLLFLEAGKKTSNAGLNFVPFFVINEQTNQEYQDAIYKDLLTFLSNLNNRVEGH